MERISLEQLDARADQFDRAVLATPEIDHFCSSSLWILPAYDAIMGRPEPYVLHGSVGTLALCRGSHPQGMRYLQPMEAAWALACPLASADPRTAAVVATDVLMADPSWHLLLLAGLAPRSEVFRAWVEALHGRAEIRLGPSTRRYQASLEGGVDGFLSRRSRAFRRNLRRARARARAAGVEFETVAVSHDVSAAALYERILAVEHRSWKGRQLSGIVAPQMREFYAGMLERMARRDAERVVFARRDGVDLAYILGGVLGDAYRGLQFSFDEGVADLSLGNLCQWTEIERLCDEGITLYDLGTDVTYKRHWGEILFDTVTLIVHRA